MSDESTRVPSGGQSHAADPVGRASWILLWVLVAAYIAFFGLLSLQKHNAFQTTAFDLGNVDQAVWNTRHGRPFHMTNIEGLTNRLGTHVEPILLPISLLYFLWSDPRLLLLLQTVIIALGAWPVYLITQRALSNPESLTPNLRSLFPLLFAFVYLLFPALQSANTFDFHAVSLAPTFFLTAFYFLETERWGWYALFAVLTMSCKEDMPLLVVMLGLYALLVRRKWLVGLVTMAAAGVWFLVAVGWIMPYFDTRGVSPLANRYAHLGDAPLEMALTLITRPGLVLQYLFTAGNLGYVLALLAPVAFLSLLAPQVLMIALPPLLVNLLSSDGFMHQLEGFHYGAPLVPIVVISAAYGAVWLMRRFSRFRTLPLLLAAVVLTTSLIYHYCHGYTPLAAGFRGTWPVVTEHERLGGEIGRGIPTEASLAALPHPNPHASQRRLLTMIDRVENGLPAPLQVSSGDASAPDAEYVWLDVTNGWPLHPNDLSTAVGNLLAGDYGFEEAVDGWLLLRRGAPDKALPDAFYDFARTSDPQPQYPMRLQFLLDGEPVLESLGFDLILEPPSSSLQFYWRALQPLPASLRLYPFYFDDASGQILEDTSQRPLIATLWYPPERWQAGEVVVTRTLPWAVGPIYSVGLGVVQGDDWDRVDQRLPIRVESSDLVVRLFDNATWARLIHVEDGEAVAEVRSFDAPSPQHALDADFGGQIRLLGYDLEQATRNTGHESRLRLYWQAQAPVDTSYTVFAQLLGPAGDVRAQVDAVPQGGGYPTTWWLPGEVVADSLVLELPPDASRDGDYRLIVGLYDPATGVRLVVAGTGADFVELTSVQP
ncbi:MAG: DUF2079 domain-containing protein [Anaerolineae bacterium]|jgi:uncharacterized membrane protein